jgi:hypothetical protein
MPCYRRIAEEWSGGGAVFHSDGDVRLLLPALSQAGFAGVHLAPGARGGFGAYVDAARRAGLTPLGGIDVRSLLAEGAQAVGERAARSALADGLVIADDGGLSSAEELVAFGASLSAARAALSQARG